MKGSKILRIKIVDIQLILQFVIQCNFANLKIMRPATNISSTYFLQSNLSIKVTSINY